MNPRPLRLIAVAMIAISVCTVPVFAGTVIFGPRAFAVTNGKPQAVTETFALATGGACATAGYVVNVLNPDRGVASAIVELNGTVLLREKDFPLTGTLSMAVHVLPSNVLKVTIKGGKKGSALTVTVERELDEGACGARIEIDAPAAGATVTTRRVLVTGTAYGSRDLGIAVNGIPAQYDLAAAGTADDPFHWFVSVSPPAGPLTLEARAVTATGTTTTASRSVTFAPDAETIAIRGTPEAGVVPFTVNFDVSSSIDGEVAAWAVDLDGDGAYESNFATLPGALSATYATGGAQTVRVQATTVDGRLFTASSIVIPQTFAEADRVIRAVWTLFTDAMARGDIAAAVAQIAGAERKAKYRPALEVLGTGLPAYAAKVTDIRPIWIHGNAAHYLMVKNENGSAYGYHVYFVRDADGFWRVLQF